ncbi:eukaryotic translation initiation factor 2A isoform X1 [Penaeus vannamei]|uniref:eukaryotic translation initiation factor 2A isoform X1 n=1 Tax=Penaeus vannamei TaxID=6689 RepID=UPI000F67976A|nr:eukaryotic translation initiation factor 2A-like [Penaeus vannamei]
MTHFAVHNSTGIYFADGAPNFGSNTSNFEGFEGKVKGFAIADDGSRFAWIADGQVHVVEAPKWEKIGSLKHPRAQEVCFSPMGSFLAVWDTYIKNKDQNQAQPNLSVYDVGKKKLLRSFFQQSQISWQPQWTADEAIMARNITSEVHFFKANDLSTVAEKKVLAKLKSFSLSPSKNTHYVTFFMPSVQGAPAFVHLYRYPDFKEASNALANKSFFKVDSIDNFWNKQCTACLILTGAEMDKTGSSYYGEHMLFFLSIKGDATRITFAKPGNIHSVAWCPNGQEFFAVYGTMPSKATLFNQKCEAIAEFGSGARNTILVNPAGNIAMIGGFGNIAARFEMWDIANQKKIGETECSDTTHVKWAPCGQYLMTATCSPRLRVNNGYKIWHYSGTLQHETFVDELYAASFLPNPQLAKPFTVSGKPVKGIESSIATASKQKYIPPSQRGAKGGPVGAPSTEKKFLSQMEDPLKMEEPAQLSKSAMKNKKKREAAKKKREEEAESGGKGGKNWREPQPESPPASVAAPASGPGVQVELTGDPDKDKKIKNIKKKLDAIAKLKAEQKSGKTLEINQLSKIATEDKLLKELEDLSL